MLKQLNIGISL